MVLTREGVGYLADLSWQLEDSNAVVAIPRHPLSIVSESEAWIDLGYKFLEPWVYPMGPEFTFVKAFEWEVREFPDTSERIVAPEGLCVELKWLDADEFAHWSTRRRLRPGAGAAQGPRVGGLHGARRGPRRGGARSVRDRGAAGRARHRPRRRHLAAPGRAAARGAAAVVGPRRCLTSREPSARSSTRTASRLVLATPAAPSVDGAAGPARRRTSGQVRTRAGRRRRPRRPAGGRAAARRARARRRGLGRLAARRRPGWCPGPSGRREGVPHAAGGRRLPGRGAVRAARARRQRGPRAGPARRSGRRRVPPVAWSSTTVRARRGRRGARRTAGRGARAARARSPSTTSRVARRSCRPTSTAARAAGRAGAQPDRLRGRRRRTGRSTLALAGRGEPTEDVVRSLRPSRGVHGERSTGREAAAGRRTGDGRRPHRPRRRRPRRPRPARRRRVRRAHGARRPRRPVAREEHSVVLRRRPCAPSRPRPGAGSSPGWPAYASQPSRRSAWCWPPGGRRCWPSRCGRYASSGCRRPAGAGAARLRARPGAVRALGLDRVVVRPARRVACCSATCSPTRWLPPTATWC